MRYFLIILISLLPLISQAELIGQSGHQNVSYQFYAEEIEVPKEISKPSKAKKDDPYPYTTKMKKIKNEMLEAQNRYLLNPTEENTILLQKAIISVYAMGQRASMARIQMLSTHPEYSYRASNPTESNARLIANQKTLEKQRQAAMALAKTHALLFFYKADDQKAIELAPVMVEFAKTYGFLLKGVPLSGQTISSITDNFMDIAHNKAVANSMHIIVLPSLVLLNGQTGQYQPVFFGYAAKNEILQMMYLIQTNFDYKAFFHD